MKLERKCLWTGVHILELQVYTIFVFVCIDASLPVIIRQDSIYTVAALITLCKQFWTKKMLLACSSLWLNKTTSFTHSLKTPTTQLDLNPVIGSKNGAVVLCYPAALHGIVFERLQAEHRRQWLQK